MHQGQPSVHNDKAAMRTAVCIMYMPEHASVHNWVMTSTDVESMLESIKERPVNALPGFRKGQSTVLSGPKEQAASCDWPTFAKAQQSHKAGGNILFSKAKCYSFAAKKAAG